MDHRRVGVGRSSDPSYPKLPPFDPGEAYPEMFGVAVAGLTPNPVYAAVRDALRHAGLDAAHVGTSQWNPLGDIVRPGMRVLLKPNMVRHENHGTGGTDCLVTHGSVVRVALDYVLRALEGRGEVWIGDAPIQSGDFERTLDVTGLRGVVEDAQRRSSIPIRVIDFRRVATEESAAGLPGVRRELPGDPNGFIAVDVGQRSLLAEIDGGADRYRVTGYDAEETPQHHTDGKHEYLLARTALIADAIINLPKLKTHRKAGMTCALKNLVGINGDKSWLPHHRAGSIEEGGDEYQSASSRKAKLSQLDARVDMAAPGLRRVALDVARRALRVTNRVVPFQDPYREGSWWGNDTVWRMALDLNRAALWARDGGVWTDERRPWLNIVDAIVCGENDGPIRPDPLAAGVILVGTDSAMVDLACARMAGFDVASLPIVLGAFGAMHFPVTSCRPEELDVVPELPSIPLRPSFGWRGRLDRATDAGVADDVREPAPIDAA
ncbi:MAG: DUF362 domain-containing protein [Planctomycetes bacterium]|nr:DUF362 domain-containing protein [Planctomycetota bacterium]